MFVFCHFLLFVFLFFFRFFVPFFVPFCGTDHVCFFAACIVCFFCFSVFLFRFEVFFYRFCLTFLFNIVSLSHRTCSGLSLLVR